MWRGLLIFSSCVKFLMGMLFRGWEGDGREQALLKHVLENSEMGNPLSVIQAIDEFARSGTWFMNIGDEKGRILDKELANANPDIVLELGTYCGYSAVRMAMKLRKPESRIISIELMPATAEIARKIIAHAGLSNTVEVLLAPLSDQVDRIQGILKSMNNTKLDFVFIDHDKDLYLSDYLVLKNNRLLGEGSIVFADNMGFPGSPMFWKYLKENPEELETVYIKSSLEYIGWLTDTITVSKFHSFE